MRKCPGSSYALGPHFKGGHEKDQAPESQSGSARLAAKAAFEALLDGIFEGEQSRVREISARLEERGHAPLGSNRTGSPHLDRGSRGRVCAAHTTISIPSWQVTVVQ